MYALDCRAIRVVGTGYGGLILLLRTGSVTVAAPRASTVRGCSSWEYAPLCEDVGSDNCRPYDTVSRGLNNTVANLPSHSHGDVAGMINDVRSKSDAPQL
jgi:hypothetical protein